MEILEASPADAAMLAPLVTEWRQDTFGPDEPPCTEVEATAWFQPMPDRRRVALVARDGDDLVGYARVQLRTDAPVPAFAPELWVAPAARRRGVGRALVQALVDTGTAAGAPRLILRQDDARPDAAAFADAVGATVGFRGLQNRCRIDRLEGAELQRWVAEAEQHAAGWSLVGWDGPCPDELLDGFVEVQAGMDDAPVPDMAVTHHTAEDIRRAEATAEAAGIAHWVLVARRDDDGAIGGFTEIMLRPDQPWLAQQGDTAVVPAHRGLRMGRWLKAAMALRLLAERPEVTQIETNTAEDNPPMRAINEAMGFEVAVVWQDRELPLG